MANFFDRFDAAQSRSGNFFDQFDTPSRSPQNVSDDVVMGKPDIGRGRALAIGAGQGVTANFFDEYSGLFEAGKTGNRVADAANPLHALVGLARVGYENLTGKNDPTLSGLITGQQPKGPSTAAYERGRDTARAETRTAQEQYPGTTLAGEVGGAIVNPRGNLGRKGSQ